MCPDACFGAQNEGEGTQVRDKVRGTSEVKSASVKAGQAKGGRSQHQGSRYYLPDTAVWFKNASVFMLS